MYFTKLKNVFHQIAKCICSDCETYLSKLQIQMARKGRDLVTMRIIRVCGEWLLVITETTIRGHNDHGAAGSNMPNMQISRLLVFAADQ